MDKSRRKLLFASAGGTALAAVLAACGGGGGGGYSSTPTPPPPPPPPGTLSCGASGTAISGNHGHLLTIPAADVDSMVDMTYNIQGSADHNHTVTLTVAQLRMIKAMNSVTVMSSINVAHDHDVTVNCA